jgi:nicotinamide riboside transporter PnuC
MGYYGGVYGVQRPKDFLLGCVAWVMTLLAIVGVVMNILKSPSSFGIWIVTNTAWMLIDWNKGIKSQSVLQAVYLILSIWGLFKWMS